MSLLSQAARRQRLGGGRLSPLSVYSRSLASVASHVEVQRRIGPFYKTRPQQNSWYCGENTLFGSSRYFSSDQLNGNESNADVQQGPPSTPPGLVSSLSASSREGSKHQLLRLRDRPLGTFDWNDWEIAVAEFASCLDALPSSRTRPLTTTEHSVAVGEKDNRGENQVDSVHDEAKTATKLERTSWLGTGRLVLQAEEWLNRFHLEARTRSFVSKQFLQPLDLCVMSLATVDAWLQLHRVFPQTPIPLQRAQEQWQGMAKEWHRFAVEQPECYHYQPRNDDTRRKEKEEAYQTAVQACVDITRAWVRYSSKIQQEVPTAMANVEGLEPALSLLLSPDLIDFFDSNPQPIVPVFHEVLKQCLSTVGAEHCAAKLLQYMEKVANNVHTKTDSSSSWESIRPALTDLQRALGLDLTSSGKEIPFDEGSRQALVDEAGKRLLYRQVMSNVENATTMDDNLIEQALSVWSTLENPDPLQHALSLAMAEYFLRMGDVVEATSWIQRLGEKALAEISKGHDGNRVLGLLAQTVVLWIQNREDHASAYHHAEAILTLYEKVCSVVISQGTQFAPAILDNRLHLALARSWFSSGELLGFQKAANVALRPETPNLDLLEMALEAYQQWRGEQKIPIVQVSKAYRWFMKLVPSMAFEQVKVNGEKLIATMITTDRQSEAVSVFQMLVDRKIALSGHVAQCLLTGIKESSQLHSQVVQILLSGSRKVLTPPLAMTVVQSMEPYPSEMHLSFIDDLISSEMLSSADGNMVEETEVVPFLRGCTDKLLEWNEPIRALGVLDKAEAAMTNVDSRVPLECYQDVITHLLKKQKNGSLASQVFRRIRSQTESTSSMTTRRTQPLPHCEFCEKYINSVTGTGNWLFSECRHVLSWLAKMYKDSGDVAFKPKFSMYSKLLYYLYQLRGEEEFLVPKTKQLIQEMAELNLHDSSDTLDEAKRPFHQALQIACKCSRDECFDLALNIYKIMEQNGVGADSTALNKLLWTSLFYRDINTRPLQLQTVMNLFGEARTKGIVSEHSYSLGFQVIDRLARGHVREPVIERMFQLCCQDGFLSDRVKDDIRRMVPQRSWNRIYSFTLKGNTEEPKDWSRNIEGNHLLEDSFEVVRRA